MDTVYLYNLQTKAKTRLTKDAFVSQFKSGMSPEFLAFLYGVHNIFIVKDSVYSFDENVFEDIENQNILGLVSAQLGVIPFYAPNSLEYSQTKFAELFCKFGKLPFTDDIENGLDLCVNTYESKRGLFPRFNDKTSAFKNINVISICESLISKFAKIEYISFLNQMRQFENCALSTWLSNKIVLGDKYLSFECLAGLSDDGELRSRYYNIEGLHFNERTCLIVTSLRSLLNDNAESIMLYGINDFYTQLTTNPEMVRERLLLVHLACIMDHYLRLIVLTREEAHLTDQDVSTLPQEIYRGLDVSKQKMPPREINKVDYSYFFKNFDSYDSFTMNGLHYQISNLFSSTALSEIYEMFISNHLEQSKVSSIYASNFEKFRSLRDSLRSVSFGCNHIKTP